MLVQNGIVIFQGNEQQVWENILGRQINEIDPETLRSLGEARVQELHDEGNEVHARFVAQTVADIPPMLH